MEKTSEVSEVHGLFTVHLHRNMQCTAQTRPHYTKSGGVILASSPDWIGKYTPQFHWKILFYEIIPGVQHTTVRAASDMALLDQ